MGTRLLGLLGLTLALLLFALNGQAAYFSGRVVKVTYGDTLQVLHQGKAEKIRLAGIDCPEKGQPYGQAARRFTLKEAARKS